MTTPHSLEVDTTPLCGCIACQDMRKHSRQTLGLRMRLPSEAQPGWRESCEICRRSACDHHVSHHKKCDGAPYVTSKRRR